MRLRRAAPSIADKKHTYLVQIRGAARHVCVPTQRVGTQKKTSEVLKTSEVFSFRL
jgi:hypothetical protein